MPRLFSYDCLLDDVIVGSGGIILPLSIFNIDYNTNDEDENFVDDNLPFPCDVSIGTQVPEPYHYDDRDALVVHFDTTEKINLLNQMLSYFHYSAY